MLTYINNVRVVFPYYSLKSDRPIRVVCADMFNGDNDVTLFTFAASNGAFFRGYVCPSNGLMLTTVTYKSKLYLLNLKPGIVSHDLPDADMFTFNLLPIKPEAWLNEGREELKGTSYKTMEVFLPRIIDTSNMCKWFGLMAKPIWNKE